MSEYQYYEFAAIDRPLTPAQQAELRSRSSRASITPTRFVNEYHWGDLKGDPLDWMQRYFDAHVYSANWGTCRLLLPLARAAAEARRQAERARALALLAEDPDRAWHAIDTTLQRGSGAAYDQALQATRELAEAMAQADREAEFRRGFARLQRSHGQRPAWVARLGKAGLSWEPRT